MVKNISKIVKESDEIWNNMKNETTGISESISKLQSSFYLFQHRE